MALSWLTLCGGQAQAAQTEIAPAPRGAEIAGLEREYSLRSLHRNQIASQLNRLWREERFLKEDYEYSGGRGDTVANTEVARELLRTRQQIDSLRAELSRENQAIRQIASRLPD